MRSMTGYGRGQSGTNGAQFCVELNSVNRKQSDIAVTLPRELAALEPRVRDLVNAAVSRGRLNVIVNYQTSSPTAKAAIDTELARTYYAAMLELQKRSRRRGKSASIPFCAPPASCAFPKKRLHPTTHGPTSRPRLRKRCAN